jgi:hypothetical protein
MKHDPADPSEYRQRCLLLLLLLLLLSAPVAGHPCCVVLCRTARNSN